MVGLAKYSAFNTIRIETNMALNKCLQASGFLRSKHAMAQAWTGYYFLSFCNRKINEIPGANWAPQSKESMVKMIQVLIFFRMLVNLEIWSDLNKI
jgi:hypothetical protein